MHCFRKQQKEQNRHHNTNHFPDQSETAEMQEQNYELQCQLMQTYF